MRDLPAFIVPLALAGAVALAAAVADTGSRRGPADVRLDHFAALEAPAPTYGPTWRAGAIERRVGPPSGVERLLDDALDDAAPEAPPLVRRHAAPDGDVQASAQARSPVLELLTDMDSGERDALQRISLRAPRQSAR